MTDLILVIISLTLAAGYIPVVGAFQSKIRNLQTKLRFERSYNALAVKEFAPINASDETTEWTAPEMAHLPVELVSLNFPADYAPPPERKRGKRGKGNGVVVALVKP